jgi:hypothetical protein
MASRAPRALVTLRRHGRKLTVKIRCPSAAGSACTVTIELRRVRRMHGHTRPITLATRTLRLAPGRAKRLVFTNSLLLSRRSQLRLEVATRTSLGRAQQSLSIPR